MWLEVKCPECDYAAQSENPNFEALYKKCPQCGHIFSEEQEALVKWVHREEKESPGTCSLFKVLSIVFTVFGSGGAIVCLVTNSLLGFMLILLCTAALDILLLGFRGIILQMYDKNQLLSEYYSK